jgi:hypothetical protein
MLLEAMLVAGAASALLPRDVNVGGLPRLPWNPCDLLALS